MTDWRIERLNSSHERGAFNCGKPPLDEFLRSLIGQYERRNLGRSYVATRNDESRVLGYYTLASGALTFESLPLKQAKKLPKHPVPVALLARLAVDQSVQGQGLGEYLLLNALRRCLDLAETIGVHAIEVDPIDLQAQAFYLRYGFVPLLDREFHLYLPIITFREKFGS